MLEYARTHSVQCYSTLIILTLGKKEERKKAKNVKKEEKEMKKSAQGKEVVRDQGMKEVDKEELNKIDRKVEEKMKKEWKEEQEQKEQKKEKVEEDPEMMDFE